MFGKYSVPTSMFGQCSVPTLITTRIGIDLHPFQIATTQIWRFSWKPFWTPPTLLAAVSTVRRVVSMVCLWCASERVGTIRDTDTGLLRYVCVWARVVSMGGRFRVNCCRWIVAWILVWVWVWRIGLAWLLLSIWLLLLYDSSHFDFLLGSSSIIPMV